jgi:hypothetical protein
VGDEAARLDGKEKIIGNTRGPIGVGLRLGKMIEGIVDLGGRKLSRVEFQVPPAGQLLGIKRPPPARIGPSGRADQNTAAHVSHCMA